jgi:hypothetical protein
MYCSHCGAPDQKGRFCVHCGTAVGAKPAPQPSINNTVDVTVNVGGPVFTSARPRSQVTLAELARALKERSSSPKLEYQQLREIAEERLRACDLLIAEIEGTIALDLLPVHSATHSQYRGALEQRAEGVADLQKAVDRDTVSIASDKLSRAAAGLITTRDALAAIRERE